MHSKKIYCKVRRSYFCTMRILASRLRIFTSPNSCRTILRCLLMMSLYVVSINFVYVSRSTLVKLGSDCVEEIVYDFSTSNDDDKVDRLNFVCVQNNEDSKYVYRRYENGWSSYWYMGEKKYRMPAMSCEQEQKRITTSGFTYKSTGTYRNRLPFHGFRIDPSNDNVPKGFTLSNETAFFLGRTDLPFEPENLFHFIKQIFLPLYFMMASSNNLNSKSHNVIFYHRPQGRCPSTFKRFNMQYARPYFDLLKVADPYTSVFEDSAKPNKVCYKTAYFSSSRHLNRARGAIEYIKKSFGVTNAACHSASKLLTFVARKGYRHVVNEGDLIQVAESMGYETKIAHLETMSHPEQAQLMQCTDVLVGVAGAGLQWAYFMKNHSGVIEIAWPHMQWPFFFSSTDWTGPSDSKYSEMNAVTPLSFAQLRADKCHHNPNAIRVYYEQIYKEKHR